MAHTDSDGDDDDLASGTSLRSNLFSEPSLFALAALLTGVLLWSLFRSAPEIPGRETPATLSAADAGSRTPAGDVFAEPPPESRPAAVESVDHDVLEVASRLPPLERKFPPHPPAPAGVVFQFGVFSRLESAESVQARVMALGLPTRVDKRAADTGMQYVVLLGPVADSAEVRRIRKLLVANNIDHFQRR